MEIIENSTKYHFTAAAAEKNNAKNKLHYTDELQSK